MNEFWNSETTEASWEGLKTLSKETKFVLIGGWAAYLHTKLQKSKDIDIVVDYGALRLLESNYQLSKNERLMKYEIKKDRYDIDIYLSDYSRLVIPPKDILQKYHTTIDGFETATAESLMALKLGAAADRGKTSKGQKDHIDILGLLFYSKPELKTLQKILSEYKISGYIKLLESILANFDLRDLNYLNLNENSFAKLKRKYIAEIKEL